MWEKYGKINNTNDLNFFKPLVSLILGALGEIRTHDFWIRSPTLYPTELQMHIIIKLYTKKQLKTVAYWSG